LQIVASPGGFWDAVKHNRDGIDIFLAAGIASEAFGGTGDLLLAGVVRLGTRFAARAASDLTIGVGSSIGAGASRGFKHFDWNAFGQGLELSVNPLLTRGTTGLNVRSGFQLNGEQLAAYADKLDKMPEATAMVFREKTALTGSTTESPLQQALHLGTYHERLIAFTKDEFFLNEVVDTGIRVGRSGRVGSAALKGAIRRLQGKFEFVGAVEDFTFRGNKQKAFFGNPWNVNTVVQNSSGFLSHELPTRTVRVSQYGVLTNNCQHHAYAVLQDLGLR
jgi:hypothetical protein